MNNPLSQPVCCHI